MVTVEHNHRDYKLVYLARGQYHLVMKYSGHVVATFRILIELGVVAGTYDAPRGRRLATFSNRSLMNVDLYGIVNYLLRHHPMSTQL